MERMKMSEHKFVGRTYPAPIFVTGTDAENKCLNLNRMTTVDFILSALSKIGAGLNSQTLRYNLCRSNELHKLSAH
jgi:hypothetical protein